MEGASRALLQKRSLKKRVKVTGVTSVGILSRARHCDGSAIVRSRFHLFSTVIHAVGSIVATVAILQLTN